MHCPNCKLPLSEDDTSCYNCDTKIEQKAKPVMAVAHKKSDIKKQLQDVAKAQKMAMGLMVGMIVTGFGFTGISIIFAVLGISFLTIALKKKYTPLWILGAFLPFVNLILLLVINSDATAFLKKHGVRVGFLGADINDINEYSTDNLKSKPSKTPKKRNFWGNVIETKEEAEKTIRISSYVFYFFGGSTLLFGWIVSIAVSLGGLILLVPTFFLHKKKSRTAAIFLLVMQLGEIAVRLESGVNGLLTPIIGIWFGIKAVQATFIWHKLKKQHSDHPPAKHAKKSHTEAETLIA